MVASLRCPLLLAGAVLLLGSCRSPRPVAAPCVPLDAAAAAAARPHLLPQQAAPSGCTAEVRFTLQRPDGQRLRGTASLALRRPDRLRLEVMGPHGGVVWALLSDGRRLIWLDASRGARQQGPATAAQIDAWLGLPLQLEVAQLTALLWGELEVPATAQLCAGPQQLEARWQTAAADFCAGIDAVDGRLRRLQRLPRQATQLAASLTIEAIGPQGPARRWQATLGRGDTALQVQVRLRDLQCEPPPATELFSL